MMKAARNLSRRKISGVSSIWPHTLDLIDVSWQFCPENSFATESYSYHGMTAFSCYTPDGTHRKDLYLHVASPKSIKYSVAKRRCVQKGDGKKIILITFSLYS
jgi:hypothetical protein